jgi:predicted metalloprotease with PDZ domain
MHTATLVNVIALMALGLPAAARADSPGPSVIWPSTPIATPRDVPYPGTVELVIDASDVAHRVVHVHETLSGVQGDTVLLYPKWLPGTHAPEGPIDRLAGIKISAAGTPVTWTRDPVDVFAFRVHPAAGVHSIDVDFDYLSPTSSQVGALEMSRDVLMLELNEFVLYPAGYFSRQIPVDASVMVPQGWVLNTALETASTDGPRTVFKRTPLNTFVDSPIYAGRYTARIDLDPGSAVPVHIDLFGDRPELLKTTPEIVGSYRALVQQAYKLFGSHHYAHYDFLYSLSDQIQQAGLEHHQSSEDGSDPESFTKWGKTAADRDLLAHEFTHSWNGKFRRPADLWTPNYNVPMQDSLLWVYEGQTQYWGKVLAARSGLWNRQQALDDIALTAAYDALETGRQWRPLEDTTNDEIINPRRPQSWSDWQRFEDYYQESALIWLDADTLIRERSKGKRSLDDFARSFFGIDDGSFITVTYTFDDVVAALNAVEPYDWAAFLRQRLESVNNPSPLDGLRRGGYDLVYTDEPGELLASSEDQRKRVDLLYSIGIELEDKDKPGVIRQVIWNSPAYKANLTESMELLAVNGTAYSSDVLKDAINASRGTKSPIELILKNGDRFLVAYIDYHDGLRYPHLKPVHGAGKSSAPPLLDQIFSPRK